MKTKNEIHFRLSRNERRLPNTTEKKMQLFKKCNKEKVKASSNFNGSDAVDSEKWCISNFERKIADI